MTILHLAVADDDVLGWHVALTSVAVTTALDGDTVVASVEEAVFYQHTVAALWVATVTVRSVVNHFYATNGDIGGVQRMDHPEWRTQQGDVLQQDAFALVEANQLWAQTIFGSENALRATLTFLIIHRYAVLTILKQARARTATLTDGALFPSETGIAVPWPPGVVATTTIDGALAGDGNILGLESINTRREVKALQAFP